MIGQAVECATLVAVAKADPAQWLGLLGDGPRTGQYDGLIAVQVQLLVERARVAPPPQQIRLGADSEEGPGRVQAKQTPKVDLGPVHEGDSSGLGREFI